jgi:hypothetical protein
MMPIMTKMSGLGLFGSYESLSVMAQRNCTRFLRCQIEILKVAYKNNWSKLIDMLDGGLDSLEELLPDY